MLTLTLTKPEKEIEQGTLDMLKMASMIDIDTFIEQATRIAAKAKRNPNHSIEAKQEAHILLEQLEEYLEAKGLNVSDNSKTST